MLHFIRLRDVSITWNDLYFEQDFVIMIKPDFPETFIHTVNFTALQISTFCKYWHGVGFKQWTFHKCKKIQNYSVV